MKKEDTSPFDESRIAVEDNISSTLKTSGSQNAMKQTWNWRSQGQNMIS